MCGMYGCRPRIAIANTRIWRAAAPGKHLATVMQTWEPTTFGPVVAFCPGIDVCVPSTSVNHESRRSRQRRAPDVTCLTTPLLRDSYSVLQRYLHHN